MTPITIIWIICAIINFIVAIYYFSSYISEKKESDKWYNEQLKTISYESDLKYCLYHYKLVYDKYYNKFPKDDFDVKYAKKLFNKSPEVISTINRIKKDDLFH